MLTLYMNAIGNPHAGIIPVRSFSMSHGAARGLFLHRLLGLMTIQTHLLRDAGIGLDVGLLDWSVHGHAGEVLRSNGSTFELLFELLGSQGALQLWHSGRLRHSDNLLGDLLSSLQIFEGVALRWRA